MFIRLRESPFALLPCSTALAFPRCLSPPSPLPPLFLPSAAQDTSQCDIFVSLCVAVFSSPSSSPSPSPTRGVRSVMCLVVFLFPRVRLHLTHSLISSHLISKTPGPPQGNRSALIVFMCTSRSPLPIFRGGTAAAHVNASQAKRRALRVCTCVCGSLSLSLTRSQFYASRSCSSCLVASVSFQKKHGGLLL